MRTAFINQLVEEAKSNEKIFLMVGDVGYNVVELRVCEGWCVCLCGTHK